MVAFRSARAGSDEGSQRRTKPGRQRHGGAGSTRDAQGSPLHRDPAKPVLGFDLKFHSGFDISVPLKELSGSENLLTILFRVTSNEKKEEPVYFSQKIRVPSVDADAKGDAYLQGTFDIGEGNTRSTG